MKPRLLAFAACALIQAGCGGGARSSVADSALAQPAGTDVRDPTVPEPTTTPADSSLPSADSLSPLKPAGHVSAARRDTASGVVKLLGAAPTAQLTLVQAGGAGSIALTGPSAAALERSTGAQIWVSGTITTGPGRPLAAHSMKVEQFVVRAVDGVSVTDGFLVADGDALVLVDGDGKRHRLVTPPAALRSQVGARVWIAGPIDREPSAFGIIQPRS